MREQEKTKLVVDDTTVYEIDLECQECQQYPNPEVSEPTPTRGTIHWDFPPPDCKR